MPNYCDYEMKIKGSKQAIRRVVKCLEADYNYSKGKPEHRHFFRVFDVFQNGNLEKNDDGTWSLYVYGDCAWSVYSAMVSKTGESYYYACKEKYPQDFMGTTLLEESKNCEIEVFSEEIGCMFSEHYLFKNGKCLIDDLVELKALGYDKDGNLTEHIDWDNYEDEIVYDNPHREALGFDMYRWTI